MKDPADLTPLQARILGLLWDGGEATVGEVHGALVEETGHARNTVGTVVVRMHEHGWLERTKRGREYVYRPALSRTQARASKVGRLVRSLFHDDVASLMSHALEEGDWDEEDLDRVAAWIERHREGEAP